MTEHEFFCCLRSKFDAKAYALMPQVRNQTGFSRTVRTADALAVSLWPSRGIDVHGFEFKDSRTDWLKELKAPEKSEEIGRFCSFWWLVVSDPKIYSPEELPSSWGALHACDGAVSVLKKAPIRDAQQPTWIFMASVMKSATECVTQESEINRRIAAAVAKATEGNYLEREEVRKKAIAEERSRVGDLEKKVREFEAASGVHVSGHSWRLDRSSTKIGEAVRFVLDGGVGEIENRMRTISGACERIISDVSTVLKELPTRGSDVVS